MKKFSYYFMLLVTVLTCGCLTTACEEDDDKVFEPQIPELNVKLLLADVDSAQFEISTKYLSQCAYLVQDSAVAKTPSNETIFDKGLVFNPSGNADTVTVKKLAANSKYVFYVTGKDFQEELIAKVDSVSFATAKLPSQLNIEFISATAKEAKFKVSGQSLKEYAYLVKSAEDTNIPNSDVISKEGTHAKITENELDTITVTKLDPKSKFVLYATGIDLDDKLLEKVYAVNFETTDQATSQLDVKFISATSTGAKFEVSAQGLKEYAYLVKSADDTNIPNSDIVAKRGTHAKVTENKLDTITVSDLEPKGNFVLYATGVDMEDNLLEKVNAVNFETTEITETITVLERKYDGFTVHVKAPQSVVEKKNAIRFTRGILPFYNMLKMQGTTDSEMLISNGGNERSTTDAVTYTFDEAHSLIVDEATGEEYEIDSPIVPGEPSVFLAGEFSYGESPYGWGEGYYTPLFDEEKWYEELGGGGMLLSYDNDPMYEKECSYWNGYHHREIIVSKEPSVLNAGVKVDTIKLTANNASLLFTPEEGVETYCVMVLDDGLYNEQIMPMFDNDDKYLQWFTTSYMAFSQLGAMSFNGVTEFNLDEFFEEGFVQPEFKFHILITSLGDINGTAQSFQHLEIVTPQRTLPAPVVEVTAIENPDGNQTPYEVWFNVKATSDVKLEKCKYVANYERDCEAMFSQGYDAASLIENSGNPFTEEEVALINSPEGFNLRFDSRANATTYLIVTGYNEEGLNSETIIGKNRSAALPVAEKVASPYFKGLEGEWTASTTLARYDYETSAWVADENPTLFKVTIGNNMACPNNLPAEVYDLYEGMSKEAVDKLYADFKNLTKDYAKRLEDQNCILCTGFNMTGVENGELEFKTPYDLFVSKDYNGYNNEALFFDFGPKWFLHVTADGKVSAPINTDYLAPMSNWKTKYGQRQSSFLVGLGENGYVGTPNPNEEDKSKWASFPVEVSEDMNTITINPIVIDNGIGEAQSYYPSPVSMSFGQARPVDGCKNVSAITLTKGWNEAAAKMNRSVSRNANAPVVTTNGKTITPMVRPMGRTSFVKPANKINRVKLTHRVTSEEFKQGATKMALQWLKGQQIQK